MNKTHDSGSRGRPSGGSHGGPQGPRRGQTQHGGGQGQGFRGGQHGKPAERPPAGGKPAERLSAGVKPAERFSGAAAVRTDRPQLLHRPAPIQGATQAPEQRRHEPRPEARHDRSPRPPEAPRGTIWLYGLHAVAAALQNPSRRLRRLLLTEEAESAIVGRLPPPWPVAPERADRGRLEQLLGRDTVHQGAALLADPLAPPSLAHALERPGPVLVLDQVTDPRNVGAILRAAAAFGAAAVITQDRNAPEETGTLAKTASGALEKVPLLRAVNIARTLVALKAAGCWVVGLDAGDAVLSGAALRDRRVALVLGSEGEGLRRLTRETCDELAGLAVPKGEMDALNVAAAGAIALYELARPL